MRVLIYNQKGGVGKTTTAINVSAALAAMGQKTLVVDLDPQMHLTAAMGAAVAEAETGFGTAEDWVAGRPVVPRALRAAPGLSLVPGSSNALTGAVDETAVQSPGWDWVIMDAPPGWSAPLGQIAGLSDMVICPLEPDFLGLNGLNQLLRRMADVGFDRERLRVLIARYSNRLAVHREVRGKLIDRFGSDIVLPVVIRSSIRLAEAPGLGQTIFEYAPKSTGASDYAQLARTLIAQRSLGLSQKRPRT